jgi:hypothetical protein
MLRPDDHRLPLAQRCLNLPREMIHFTVGKEHKHSHRMVGGVILMAVGVAIAKSVEYLHFPGSHFTLDLIGYAVHGLGATPFIERAIE